MKMHNVSIVKSALAVCSMIAVSSSAFAGDAIVLDLAKGASAVNFHAIGKPKMLKIHGKGGKAEGTLSIEDGKGSGVATFDLASLDTGIGLRNSHMKEKYLETDKFPKAKFELVSIALPNPLPNGDFTKEVPFKGKLTLRGITQNVAGTVNLKKAGDNMSGVAEFSTTVKSYNIDIPSFAGVTMADEVKVEVEFSGPIVRKVSGSVAKK